jgi:hypothetical protein
MNALIKNLIDRSEEHDQSKLSPEEFHTAIILTKALKDTTYGDYVYKQTLDRYKKEIELHYQKNDHHPEHSGIHNMNLMSLIEMVCDHMAASNVTKTNYTQSDKDRWGMGDQLAQILTNTLSAIYKEAKETLPLFP